MVKGWGGGGVGSEKWSKKGADLHRLGEEEADSPPSCGLAAHALNDIARCVHASQSRDNAAHPVVHGSRTNEQSAHHGPKALWRSYKKQRR